MKLVEIYETEDTLTVVLPKTAEGMEALQKILGSSLNQIEVPGSLSFGREMEAAIPPQGGQLVVQQDKKPRNVHEKRAEFEQYCMTAEQKDGNMARRPAFMNMFDKGDPWNSLALANYIAGEAVMQDAAGNAFASGLAADAISGLPAGCEAWLVKNAGNLAPNADASSVIMRIRDGWASKWR